MAGTEPVTLAVDPNAYSVDLTAAGSVFGALASTFDPQTIQRGGTLTLDIVASESVAQSMDFVTLAFDYFVVPNDPTVFTFAILAGLPGARAETQFILPWGTIPRAGNPVTVFDSLFSLERGNAGVETGTAGELILTIQSREIAWRPPTPADRGFPGVEGLTAKISSHQLAFSQPVQAL